MDWFWQRSEFTEKRMLLREAFERNRGITNPKEMQILVEMGERLVATYAHPQPYINMSAPGGSKWERNTPFPEELSVRPSSLPNAGLGVFIRRRLQNTKGNAYQEIAVKQGTVVALYPGVVYEPPQDPIFLPSLFNQYVIQRNDGLFIDGKSSGLSKSMYNGVWKREKGWHGVQYDRTWLTLRKEAEDVTNWNIGQLVNNGGQDNANVVYNEFVLRETFEDEWRKFIPNIPYCPSVTRIHGIALVASKDIELDNGESQELLSTYFSTVASPS
ncbi:SET domain-containing protein 9 [Chytridiales sp. JEL 0842]|nr:SET domain-containing protein 9 [Chytridiales sp. JEL 0842]